jgi:hypothetical protein
MSNIYSNPVSTPNFSAVGGGSGTNLLTQGSCMNIYVSEFDASLTGIAGTYNSVKSDVPDCDYYAVQNVSLLDMKNAFRFLSTGLNFTDLSSNSLQYLTAWPNEWNLNAANAMMDDVNSSTATNLVYDGSSIPVMPNTSPRSANLVVTHYIKYISTILFGTPYGVDLIDNARTMANSFITTTEAHWQHNFNTYIQGTNSAPLYCNNADSTKLAHILFRALLTDKKRFGDLASMSNTSWISFPFMENDSINFILNVYPPSPNNVNLSNPSIIDKPLKYCISLIINSSLADLNTVPTIGDVSFYVAPIPADSGLTDNNTASVAAFALEVAQETQRANISTYPLLVAFLALDVAIKQVEFNVSINISVTADNTALINAQATYNSEHTAALDLALLNLNNALAQQTADINANMSTFTLAHDALYVANAQLAYDILCPIGSVNYINSQNGVDTDAVTAAQAAYYAAIPPA